MKKLIIILCFAIILIFLIGKFNRDELRIRKNLTTLAQLLTKSPDEAPIVALGRANRIATFFTDDCIVTVGAPVPDICGNSELIAVVHRVRQAFYRIDVRFADISVSGIDKNTAEVALTATAIVYKPGSLRGEVEARELEVTMVKIDRLWKIQKVIVIETLH